MNDRLLITVHFKNETKKISVDKQKTVQEFIEQDIASRLELQDIAYFSVAEDIDGTDRWLDHESLMEEQKVTSSTHLHFKVKYWKHPKEASDPVVLALFYYQIQQNIVTGAWGCTEAQSMKLAAHQVQVEFGNYNPAKHKPGFLDSVGLALFLSTEYRPPAEDFNPHYQKRIFDQHATIPPLESRIDAFRRYIEIAEQLPSYGITYFKIKDEGSKDIYFGVAEEAIYLFSSPTKEYTDQFLFSHLRGWVGVKDGSGLYKGITIQKREDDKRKSRAMADDDDDDGDDDDDDYDEDDLNCKTKEVHFSTTHQQAVTILELLSGYALLLQTSLPKWRKASAAVLVDTPPPGLPPSSLFEPPSTTARVFPPKCSSSALFFKSLYLSNCSKAGVQPFLKLCQQVDDATDRNSWLNKLDLSDCTLSEKSLEPVVTTIAGYKAKELEDKQAYKKNIFFNNISLTELDLSNTQLDPQKANLQGILHADLKALNLSQNKLGTLKVGIVLLPPLISNICTHLETLDLSSNGLMKESLETLLTQRYQSLRTLILNNNKIGDKGCPLITAFISGCTTLTRVDIANIGFKDEGLDSICNSIKFSNSLQALDISGNMFSPKGAFQLQKALGAAKVLNRLVMASCKLNQDAGKIIGESLKYNSSLTSLDCRNNSFGKISYQSIADALKSNTRLCYLNLDGNPIEDSCNVLCEALVANKSLTSLSLRDTDLGKGECQIGEVLQKNSTLMNLDIANNSLTSKHIEGMYEGLGENANLIYLNLGGNPITDAGVEYLVKSVNYHESLVSLNLDGTQITDYGLQLLAEAMYSNETIRTLSLQNNRVTCSGVLAVLTALTQKAHQTLKKIDFSNNNNNNINNNNNSNNNINNNNTNKTTTTIREAVMAKVLESMAGGGGGGGGGLSQLNVIV